MITRGQMLTFGLLLTFGVMSLIAGAHSTNDDESFLGMAVGIVLISAAMVVLAHERWETKNDCPCCGNDSEEGEDEDETSN